MAIALRLAAAHAILAAMIAEFLMGTTGLGYLFAVTKQEFLTERAFGTSVIRHRGLGRGLPGDVDSGAPDTCAVHLTGPRRRRRFAKPSRASFVKGGGIL